MNHICRKCKKIYKTSGGLERHILKKHPDSLSEKRDKIVNQLHEIESEIYFEEKAEWFQSEIDKINQEFAEIEKLQELKLKEESSEYERRKLDFFEKSVF